MTTTTLAPAPLAWRDTRRDLLADLAVYGAWFPLLRETAPFWLRCAHAVLRADMFGANLLYRMQAFLAGTRARALAPWLSRWSRLLYGVAISPLVRIGGGLYIAHGHVVIEGFTTLGRRVSIAPFVTIGLTTGGGMLFELRGPTIGDDVVIGTGAKIIGPVRIGDRARIGANAVVLTDVGDDHTAVGVPARTVPARR
jgi:serine O-acetyltransferase